MRLLSLDIQNFRVLKSFAYRFGDRVMGIVGPNGAGKSSIIESIAWVLWGHQVARTGKDEIRSVFARADEPCEVTLGLAMHDSEYTIRRSISAKGVTSADMHCGQALVATGVKETQEAIGKLIGLDSRGFLASVLARQQELNALSDLRPSERKDKLATMLGVDRLDRAIDRVKGDNKVVQGKIEALGQVVAQREQLEQERRDMGEQLEAAKGEVVFAEKAVAEQRQRLKAAGEEFKLWQNKKGRVDLLGVELKGRQEQALQASEAIERLSEKLKRLDEAMERLPAMEKELADWPKVEADLGSLEKARADKKYVDSLQSQAKVKADECQAVEAETGRLERDRAGIERELAGLPDKLDEQVKGQEAELDRARGQYHDLKARRDQLQADLKKITGQLGQIDQWGPESVCDRCHRKLGDDLATVRSHFEQERSDIAENLKKADGELTRVTEAGKKLGERLDQLRKQQEKARDLVGKLELVVTSLKQNKAAMERLAQQRQKVEQQLSEAGKVTFDPQAYEKVRSEKQRLESVRREFDRLSGEVKERQSVAEDLQNARKQQKTLQKDIVRLDREIREVGYTPESFAAVQAKLESEQKRVDELTEQFSTRKEKVSRLAGDIEALDKRIAESRKQAEALAELRNDRHYGEKLVNLLGDFRQFLVGRIRPTLAELAGDLMTQMTDGRYSMVELDEQYELRVLDAGEFYGVSRFSGGEKDLANLCLRLAISQALTDSAGLPGSFVILDEVFGSQDAERKDLILRALANLKGRFPQIILVTHIEDIKDRVEELIEIVPTGRGWSEVRVNGQTIPTA